MGGKKTSLEPSPTRLLDAYKYFWRKRKAWDAQLGKPVWLRKYNEAKKRYLAAGHAKGKAASLARLEVADEMRRYEARHGDAPIKVRRGNFQSDDAQELDEVRWVGSYLNDPDVREADCPSPRAWNLLTWARTDKKAFWEKFYQPILHRQAQSDKRAGAKTADEGLVGQIEDLEAAAREASGDGTLPGEADAGAHE